MNKIVLGKFVNTHGIKGEIRIKSKIHRESIRQRGSPTDFQNAGKDCKQIKGGY